MNHVIEIDQDTFNAARQLIVCAELRSVRLLRCKLETKPLVKAPVNDDVSMNLVTKAIGSRKDESTILCEFSFTLSAVHQGPDPKPLSISVAFEAIYSVPKESEFSPKQIKAFATTNGMLNVWPYWREMVQSLTIRAGLPPLTLPLFRVHHKRP